MLLLLKLAAVCLVYYVVGSVCAALLNGLTGLLDRIFAPAPAPAVHAAVRAAVQTVPAREGRRELARAPWPSGRPRLPSVRIVRPGSPWGDRLRGERVVPFDPRFGVYTSTPSHPELARVLGALRPRLNTLLELLPRERARSLLLVAHEVLLVGSAHALPRADPGQALARLVQALERAHDEVDLALRPRAAGARCAYCHDDLLGGERECPGCRTLLHAACRAELARCPTPGCRGSTPLRQRVA